MSQSSSVDPRPGTEERASRRSFLQRSTAVAVPGLVLAGAAASRAAPPNGRVQLRSRGRGNGQGQGNGNHNGSRPSSGVPNLYPGWALRNFQEITKDEGEHVAFLKQALGGLAYDKPVFQNLVQPDVGAFAITSDLLENTGTQTYLGAAPLLSDPKTLAAAGSILTVEARHAGFINTFLNLPITYEPYERVSPAFDQPITPLEAAQRVASFFVDPRPVLALVNNISTTDRSAANDAAILRFALALEYLESEFYSLNVPRFASQLA